MGELCCRGWSYSPTVCRKELHLQLPSSQAEVREASGQGMQFHMFIFGKRAHLVLATRKTQTFKATAEEEFLSVAWLVGNGCTRTDPSPLQSAGHSQPVLLRGGRTLARSETGAVPKARFCSSPCPSSSWGKAQGWLGWESGSFAFSSPGREALRCRQPCSVLDRGKKRSCTARGLFLSGFWLVCIVSSCLPKAAQFHKAGSICISSELLLDSIFAGAVKRSVILFLGMVNVSP